MSPEQREKHDSTSGGPEKILRKSARSQTWPRLLRCCLVLLVFFVFQSQAIVWKVEQCILCNPGCHRRNPSPGLSVAPVYSALGESNSLHWPVNHAVPMAGRWRQPPFFLTSREIKKETLVSRQKTQIGRKEKATWERKTVRELLLWWERHPEPQSGSLSVIQGEKEETVLTEGTGRTQISSKSRFCQKESWGRRILAKYIWFGGDFPVRGCWGGGGKGGLWSRKRKTQGSCELEGRWLTMENSSWQDNGDPRLPLETLCLLMPR